MAKLSPSEYAEKWANRTGAATADYTRGVQRVTQAPGAMAAQRAALYAARVAESVQKWQRNVGSVSLAEWQRLATEVGAGRISAGVQAARPQMEAVAGKLLSHIDTGVNLIKAMPKASLEERIARSAAFQRHMAKFQK